MMTICQTTLAKCSAFAFLLWPCLSPVPGTAAERYVRYSFTIANQSDELVESSDVWIAAPLQQAASQRLVQLEVSGPHAVQKYDSGEQIVAINLNDTPPFGQHLPRIGALLEMSPQTNSALDVTAYLASEGLYDFSNPLFASQVPVFKGASSETTLRAILAFVRQHMMQTGYDALDRDALNALTTARGDCTDFTVLFVALCRRADFPARGMGGYRVSGNSVLDPARYHNWAEVFLDGSWIVVDPLDNVFRDESLQYVATRELGSIQPGIGIWQRFAVSDDRLQMKMNRP